MKLFFAEIFPEVKIDKEEENHISRVLRLKEGTEIHLTDGKGNLARGIISYQGKKVNFVSSEIQKDIPDFSSKIHIAIAPTKNIDRIEFFLEKATEMGVSEVTFLLTENSERKNINFERLQKQAIAASKQSLRMHFPKINPLVKLTDFLESTSSVDIHVAHCNTAFERTLLPEITSKKPLTFLVGPEGDFSVSEINLLAGKGVKAVSLGNQRLRTETAGVFLSAWNYYRMIE